MLAALQSAVAQVNGVRVASQMQGLRAGLHVDVDGEHVGDIRADAFTQQMIAGSQGAVLGYESCRRMKCGSWTRNHRPRARQR